MIFGQLRAGAKVLQSRGRSAGSTSSSSSFSSSAPPRACSGQRVLFVYVFSVVMVKFLRKAKVCECVCVRVCLHVWVECITAKGRNRFPLLRTDWLILVRSRNFGCVRFNQHSITCIFAIAKATGNAVNCSHIGKNWIPEWTKIPELTNKSDH